MTEHDPVRRIYSEFLEMPGLRLTIDQARRLWGLDATTCQQALDALIDARFLCRTGTGQYARAADGPAAFPAARMAKAALDRARPRRTG